MSDRVAFPFLTLREPAISTDEWLVALDDDALEPAGEYIRDWDYDSKIRLSRSLRVDFDCISEQLQVAEEDLDLVLMTRIGTGTGRLARLILFADRRPLSRTSPDVLVEIEVAGADLSSVLDVQMEVLLAAEPASGSALSPARTGDRLWSHRLRLRLEGEEPRFPIEVADLRALLGDVAAASAPWYLHWCPGDWLRDFHGAVRLYLNSDFPEIIRRVEEGDSLILQAILADVIGQIGERLLMDPDLAETGSGLEPGSLAAQALAWLRLAWPQHDLSLVRSVLENRPGDFRASVLALAELREE